jgi:hypothetical protein
MAGASALHKRAVFSLMLPVKWFRRSPFGFDWVFPTSQRQRAHSACIAWLMNQFCHSSSSSSSTGDIASISFVYILHILMIQCSLAFFNPRASSAPLSSFQAFVFVALADRH